MEYEVCCYLGPHHDFHHASRIYTGLCDLARNKILRLRFIVPNLSHKGYTSDPYTICLQVTSVAKKRRFLIAIDLSDHCDRFNSDVLTQCDVYLKRSYNALALSAITTQLKNKMYPFGLNYAARSIESTMRVLMKVAPRLSLRLLSSPKRSEYLGVLWRYWRTPKPKHFELAPNEPVERVVTFQTRVWATDKVTDEVERINTERVQLIRRLKRTFGSRFRGGLYPDAYARQHFRDVVSDMPSRPADYINWGKHALIGVNTRGLHHSIAFKLPEYLAASKCVVSSPLHNQLPTPLVAQRHYSEFRTAEECIDACARILDNANIANDMRYEAWRYYQTELKPPVHVRNCLERAAALCTQSS